MTDENWNLDPVTEYCAVKLCPEGRSIFKVNTRGRPPFLEEIGSSCSHSRSGVYCGAFSGHDFHPGPYCQTSLSEGLEWCRSICKLDMVVFNSQKLSWREIVLDRA